ncbi:hypothetical protein [Izhakiella capsodis]|uniref:hypothetical protein n=1 Tax=Izhakiella capsodis TaxID=1367852 RepID=UPI000B864709|nr:hypothetical protein [Izhakiella capsodis]
MRFNTGFYGVACVQSSCFSPASGLFAGRSFSTLDSAWAGSIRSLLISPGTQVRHDDGDALIKERRPDADI